MIGITVLTAHGTFTFHKGDLLVAIAALGYSIYLLLNSSFTRNVESISYGIYQLGFLWYLCASVNFSIRNTNIAKLNNFLDCYFRAWHHL